MKNNIWRSSITQKFSFRFFDGLLLAESALNESLRFTKKRRNRKANLSAILALLFCSLLLGNPLLAQQNQPEASSVQLTYAEKIGTTPPVRNLIKMPAATNEKRKTAKDKRREIPNFANRRAPSQEAPHAKPIGQDPVRQFSSRNTGLMVEPIVNKDGIGQDIAGATPPDPDGDIGSKYYVQVLNASYFLVHDKEGNELSEPIAFNTIWTSIGFSSAGDPIVLYDQEFDRWIFTEFPSGNQLLFAISDTDDPLGTWTAYNFGTPSFPDYPKYSLWPNAFVVTTNEQGPGTLPLYLINREGILNGDDIVPIQRIELPGVGSGPGFQVATPVDWSGSMAPATDDPIILGLNDDAWGQVDEDQLEMWTVSIDWSDPNNTVVTNIDIPTAPFDTNPCAAPGFGFACIPQPNGNGIDGLPEVIMNQSHYRNFGSHESIVLNFITDADGNELSGIRWMELRRVNGSDWTVYQEGTYAPDDGLHRFMGGIAMDGNGNIALGYSVSGLDEFPGLRFTGRRAGDPLGEMTVEEYIAVAGEGNVGGSRFGDYAKMAIDPSDDRTFWFTGEYAGANGWKTRIFSFNLGRDTIDLGATALVTPQNSPSLTASETVEIQIKNFGIDTPSVFNVGYIFENGTPIIDTINFELAPDSTYNHIFMPTVDLSVVGEYEFRVFTDLADDQAPFNDTLFARVSKLPRKDVGVIAINGLNGTICNDTIDVEITFSNFGTEAVTEVTINVELNDVALSPIQYSGPTIAPGETGSFNLQLIGLVNGTNVIVATTSNPDGEADEIADNDTFTRDFTATPEGVSVFLELLTDDYPSETTWEVTDDAGNILFSGGPYTETETQYTEEFCLDPEGCYTFTIFDSYGDGICCGFGEGNYQIEDADGLPLLSSTGEFADSESNDFCATFDCTLSGSVSTSPESEDGASDATIMINTDGGVGPFQFSIDGGQSFQANGLFDGLPAGEYNILIQDDAGCDYEELVVITSCAIDLMAEVSPEMEVGTMTGSIIVAVAGGNPPFQYSIDGGQIFQEEGTFEGLSAGDYTIIVTDSIGCRKEIEVTVDFVSNNNKLVFGQIIELFPNPTDGVFRVDVKGIQNQGTFLKVEILNIEGKLIQANQLTKYDDTYTGQLSLVAYPSGTYFVRFKHDSIDHLLKVIKK